MVFTVISFIVALFLFAMFVEFALFPDRYMQRYFGETIDTPAGRNEIRAMIGGTNLGLGCLMLLGGVLPQYQAQTFLAVGIVGVAIGGTRVLFLWKDRPHTVFNRLDATVEPIGGLLLIAFSFYV